jgi:hypothetical protein
MSNPENLDEIEIWKHNHTWYDEFEMGAIDLLLEEMGDEFPEAQLIIRKIKRNLEN